MRTLLCASEISSLIASLAQQILSDAEIAATPPERLAVVGVRRRGELIAQRLASIMISKIGQPVALGALDITMYRDDVVGKRPITIPIGTQMNFRLDDRVVILVDDVLFTGRTIRSAMDALIDIGRPNTIQLAVLVDRGHRELPISADYVGKNLPTAIKESVVVHLAEVDGTDEILLVEEDEGPK